MGNDIRGWFDFQDFYDMAVEKYASGNFLEIGGYAGKSCLYLCERIKQKGKDIFVSVIDLFPGDLAEEFKRNLIMHDVNIIKGDSAIVHAYVANKSMDMIYIDAAHDYASVKNDLKNFYGKIKGGGLMGGHDYFEPTCGVKQAVHDFADENNLTVHTIGSSWYYD